MREAWVTAVPAAEGAAEHLDEVVRLRLSRDDGQEADRPLPIAGRTGWPSTTPSSVIVGVRWRGWHKARRQRRSRSSMARTTFEWKSVL